MAPRASKASGQAGITRRAQVFKALSDPCRVRIVELLARKGDLNV